MLKQSLNIGTTMLQKVGIQFLHVYVMCTNFLTVSDTKVAVAFLLIPYLIVPPLVTRGTKKGKWKPSKRESQESFLLHLNTLDELQPNLQRIRDKCLQNGDTLQPLPVIIGNFDKLQSYIVIDSYTYKVDTVLSCVDVCFKLFHALRAEYPKESHHIWYFFQKYVYGITECGEKTYVGVNTFISDLSN